MTSPKENKYFAFISYKREDEKWAKWLQHKLEHYKLPYNLNGRTDLPKEIRPIFRDQSELAAGVLADEIKKALTDSKYLIVICSLRAAQSQWVGKEVQTFIDLGRADKIIPFIIGGTAHARNPEDECFPLALLNLPPEQELLGINIDEMGRDAAAVKVVAQMFGLKFDELWQRYEREQKRKRRLAIFGITAFAIVALGVAGWIWQQNIKIEEQNNQIKRNQSRVIANMAEDLTKEGDSYTACRLLLEVLSDDYPRTNEAEIAFEHATKYNSAILKGHNGWCLSANYSPDGHRIVSASMDHGVIVWDADDGRMIHHLNEHNDIVTSASFSPDGKRIVSASWDKTIIIWDAISGEVIKRISDLQENDSIRTICYSPDGAQIASASYNNTITIRDATTGEHIHTLKGHTDKVFSASYSPNSRYIVTASGDKSIRIWNSKDGTEICKLLGHIDGVCSAAFSPDGLYVVSASNDSTIRLWDVEKRSTVCVFKGHKDGVTSVSFSPDGKKVLSSSLDHTIREWDLETGNFNVVVNNQNEVSYVSYSPDGKQIAYTSIGDGSVRLWGENEFANKNEIYTFEGHTDAVTSASFSSDGKHIITASWDNSVKIWDVETHEEIKTLKGHKDKVRVALFSPNNLQILSASQDGTIIIWDAMTGEIVHRLCGHEDNVCSAAFSPDGNRIVSSSWDKTIRIWDVNTGNEISVYNHLSSAVSFSPDGRYFVGANKIVGVFDAATGKIVKILKGHEDAAFSVSFSPDGKRIVSASKDKTIRVWDIETEKEIFIMKGHKATVYSALFSPNGNRIVSASKDRTVRIWDAHTGQELVEFDGHYSTPMFATYSPDGGHIVSTGLSAVLLWNATDDDYSVKVVDVKEVNDINNEQRRIQNHQFKTFGSSLTEVDGLGFRYFDDGTVGIRDMYEGLDICTLQDYQKSESNSTLLSFSYDGSFVSGPSTDGKSVLIWETKRGTVVHEFVGHSDQVISARFNFDGRFVASSSRDRTIIIWDVNREAPVQILAGHAASSLMGASFSLDGSLLVSNSLREIIIWDLSTGKPIHTIPGKTIKHVHFSPDGKRIVATCDNHVMVFDVETAKEIAEWNIDAASAYFNSNNTILCVLNNGTQKSLNINDLQNLVEQARKRFEDRPLTAEERRMYYLE